MPAGSVESPLLQAHGGIGPPLLMIHGLLGSTRWWSRNIEAFREEYSVYTVDLPGFGTNRSSGWFHMADVVAMLQLEIGSLCSGQVALIGHSLGGVIAGGLAATLPDRIGRIVLVDAAFLSLTPGWARRLSGIPFEWLHLSSGLVPLLLRDATRSRIPAFSSASFELLFRDWSSWLDQVEQSSLIVWGEHDRIVPLSVGRAMHRRMLDSELEIIARAGHTPMWSHPEVFNALVLRFLRQSPDLATDNGVTR